MKAKYVVKETVYIEGFKTIKKCWFGKESREPYDKTNVGYLIKHYRGNMNDFYFDSWKHLVGAHPFETRREAEEAIKNIKYPSFENTKYVIHEILEVYWGIVEPKIER